jgi:hypothetical protein
VNLTSKEPAFAVSGQTLNLGGIVTVSAEPLSQGLIVASLGENELGQVPVGNGGNFTIPLSIPIDVSGINTINLTFVPETPWVTGNLASVTLNIMNTGLVGFASVALVASAVALSTQTIQMTPPPSRKRREDEQQIEVERLTTDTKTVPPAATIHPGRLKALLDPRICVQETYWETRLLLGQVLREEEQPSETPRELAVKLNPKLEQKNARLRFSLLTLLFEVAEYSQHAISREQADLAVNYAVQVAEAINVPVRQDETWQQFHDEYETKASDILHRLGISASDLTINPTSVSLQIPWSHPDATQQLLSKTLHESLRMPINLIPVRICDKCKYKLEGSAVKLGICPECGTKLGAAFEH